MIDWVYIQKRRIRTQRWSKLYPRGDRPFHVIAMIDNNGHNLGLRGKHIIILIIDDSNVASFDAGTNSRSNPFKKRGDDVIQGRQ